MNRTVYFAGVALFLLTVAFLLTDSLVWQPGVTEANVRRIQEGMTLAEVEGILGRPCDWDFDSGGNGRSPVYAWGTEQGWALVHVRNDRVIAAEWRFVIRDATSPP